MILSSENIDDATAAYCQENEIAVVNFFDIAAPFEN
jgi:hypothetical protein